ncbi:hypothetical protein D9M71_474160 [compost metagenome]
MLYRLPQQHGQADQGVLGLLVDQGQLPLLARHQAALLGQFQCRRGTCVIAGLHQRQDVQRVFQVERGDVPLFAQGQHLQIGIGHRALQGQAHGVLIELAGPQVFLGAVVGGGLAPPEIHLVAGGQGGIEKVHGLVVIVGIELGVTIAA